MREAYTLEDVVLNKVLSRTLPTLKIWLTKKTVAEGVDFWAPVSRNAQQLINTLMGGIRSGLTYGGARNLKELQTKAEFVRVSSTYMLESNPRKC